MLLPSLLGIYESATQKNAPVGTNCSHPRHGAGEALCSFIRPTSKAPIWQEGKNHTRHVSADELPAVESALAGYAQFCQLTEDYADKVIQETRQNIAAAKKKYRSRLPSSSRRKKKSSN